VQHRVFISGGTGFIGRALTRRLLAAGHEVRLLARPSSARKVPSGAGIIQGSALDPAAFAAHVAPCDTFVHLTGAAHPAPWKTRQFREIDLASLRASAGAAKDAGVKHFLYVSVAQPAPVMQSFIRIRQECEQILAQLGLTCSIFRPWYVLGPGRWWPLIFWPACRLLELLGSESARRLGLLWQDEMIRAMQWAIENPPRSTRILDVPRIRETARGHSG
jgi:uncharacterized protein YbjT (DUF2867 family)